MEDKKQDNRKDAERRITRHTWVGEAGEPEEMIRLKSTRVVERVRKPYTGFITDEELKDSDIIKIEDRRTRLVEKSDISQTRIYSPLAQEGQNNSDAGTGAGASGEGNERSGASGEGTAKKPFIKDIEITGGKKLRGLIAVLAVIALIVIFDLSYLAMKHSIGSLPGRAETAVNETAEVRESNSKLDEEISGYGDYDQIRELKESWERLREKVEPSESAEQE